MSAGKTPSRQGHPASYDIASLKDRPDLSDRHNTVGGSAWPEFMLHDPVALAHWGAILAYFPELQLTVMMQGKIAAVINAVALRFGGKDSDLPDRGVDWGVQQSVLDHEAGNAPNALLGLQVVVDKAHRGKGLSHLAVEEMIALARSKGFGHVLLPVRPNGKADFPLIPMDEYLTWRRADGRAFDPWLRVHERLGGRVVGICHQSMIIPGTVEEWSEWTGQQFPGTGQYIVPGALCPIEVDVAANKGVYTEPNVWVVHDV